MVIFMPASHAVDASFGSFAMQCTPVGLNNFPYFQFHGFYCLLIKPSKFQILKVKAFNFFSGFRYP